MVEKEGDNANGRTTEVLQTLIQQLSSKEEADRKRDEAERANATKVRNLYLGIVASILAMVGTFITQYLSPPRIAAKSDIVRVIKDNKSIIRPDAWTGKQDNTRMSIYAKEQQLARDALQDEWQADKGLMVDSHNALRVESDKHRKNLWVAIENIREKHADDRYSAYLRLQACEIALKNLEDDIKGSGY